MVSFFLAAAGFIDSEPADLQSDVKIVLGYESRFPIAHRRSGQEGSWCFEELIYVRECVKDELWLIS